MLKANDKYNAKLSSGYTVGQNILNVTAVPDNVPTQIVAAKGTDNETVFSVTGKTTSTLTGVTRVKGANVDLDAQTPLTCLNNEEFINQFHEAATAKASGEEIDTGTEDAKIVTPKAIADSYIAQRFYNPNVIINGNFVVNQRVYVSNATLAAGAYGHDRWKAGASGGDYTFTQLPSSTQITIKAGKSLIQVIEDKNVVGGTYTLSWEGTAQARFGINSATPSGDYAASPITITTQTAGTVMSVEFNAGTLGKVVLNSGSVALPFQARAYDEELKRCQRYYYRFAKGATGYPRLANGMCSAATTAGIAGSFPVPMRTRPASVTLSGNWGVLAVSSVVAVTGTAADDNTANGYFFNATVASGLTAGQATNLFQNNDANAYAEWSAEL